MSAKKNKIVKAPELLQMEAVECGAASLGIILGYYKKFVPLEELRVSCGISRDGSKASYIVKAATKYGLDYKAFKKSLEDVKDLKPPFIIFWNFNHFLVVEGFSDSDVYLNDPATGRRKVTHEEFDESYTGIVLTFEPSENFEPGGMPFNPLNSLKKWISSGKKELSILAFLGLLAVIPALFLPIFSKVFVDQILVQNMQSWIWPLVIGMITLVGIKSLIEWIQDDILNKLDIKLGTVFSSKFLLKLLSLSPRFYLNRSATEVAGRISIVREISDFLTIDLATNIFNLLGIFVFAIVLFLYDVEMTLLTLFLALFNLIMLYRFFNKKKSASQLFAQDSGKLMATTVNGFSMIETLKAGGRERDFMKKWTGLETRVLNTMQQLGSVNGYLNTLPVFLFMLNQIVVLYWGGLKVMDGEMTMGMLLAYVIFIKYFYSPIEAMVKMSGEIQAMQGNLVRIDEILLNDQDKKDVQEVPSTEKLPPSLEVKDLTFGYNVMQEPLFNGLNLTVRPGEKVAFVGSSGSGKSTLAKIFTGLYQPWNGSILFGGRELGTIPANELADELAVVDQDIFLFEGRIRDVLTFWNNEIQDDDIIKACKDACIHDDIMKKKDGYYEVLTEGGANFSGGQRQRLEIARALLRNPRFLILDEATSALDPTTEKEIDRNLYKRGCTTIVIAHRLSTVRDCDQIIVLDKGKIVEQGKHEVLVNLGGIYSTLIKTDG